MCRCNLRWQANCKEDWCRQDVVIDALCAVLAVAFPTAPARASVLMMRKCRCARRERAESGKCHRHRERFSTMSKITQAQGEKEGERERGRERERLVCRPCDPLFMTKDYLKNYLDGNGNASRSWAPFCCAWPIEALGGAYSIPREISGVVNMDVGCQREIYRNCRTRNDLS